MNSNEFILVSIGKMLLFAMQRVSEFLSMKVSDALTKVLAGNLPIVGSLLDSVWEFFEDLGFNMDMTIIELLLGSALVLVLVYRLASFITGLFT